MSRHAPIALLVLVLAAGAAGAQDHPGKSTYEKWCAQCHGESGDGQGIATPFLKPVPRDFTTGKYKIRTTPTGSLPTDQDIANAIRRGLPYSAMPAFPSNWISDSELDDLVGYLKSLSSDFEDPEALLPAIPLPAPPAYDQGTAQTKGREVYEATGCARCHGNLGRGDGLSAPTLVDDWGNHIRVADLSMPWTFRGGGTRRDIFRTMSTGFNGTPMPGFHGALPVEDIWAITDYMVSLAGGVNAGEREVEAPYANVVRAVGTDGEIDLADESLFAEAPKSLFPLFGQIVEPGRNFHPQVYAVAAQAVYNRDEIALRVSWHDMRAETSGSNAPDLDVPSWQEQRAESGAGTGGEDDGWGDASDDPWGDVAADEPEDPWADVAAEDSGDGGGDFWGDVAGEEGGADEGDFWGDAGDGTGAAVASGPENEFSDAVAVQFPQARPQGVAKPYFIFGDAQNPVDLWFADLGQVAGAGLAEAQLWTGRGSTNVGPGEGDVPEVVASFADGEWSVLYKRKRTSRGSISFEPGTFTPIAFSVWNGFNRERGNKRALTSWYDLYLEPLERPSPKGPMTKAFFGVLALELLLIALVRFFHRRRKRTAAAAGGSTQIA